MMAKEPCTETVLQQDVCSQLKESVQLFQPAFHFLTGRKANTPGGRIVLNGV